MGPLPDHRVGPCPIFQSMAMALFGQIEYHGTVNQRWGNMRGDKREPILDVTKEDHWPTE